LIFVALHARREVQQRPARRLLNCLVVAELQHPVHDGGDVALTLQGGEAALKPPRARLFARLNLAQDPSTLPQYLRVLPSFPLCGLLVLALVRVLVAWLVSRCLLFSFALQHPLFRLFLVSHSPPHFKWRLFLSFLLLTVSHPLCISCSLLSKPRGHLPLGDFPEGVVVVFATVARRP
jgi:hypothetical protein